MEPDYGNEMELPLATACGQRRLQQAHCCQIQGPKMSCFGSRSKLFISAARSCMKLGVFTAACDHGLELTADMLAEAAALGTQSSASSHCPESSQDWIAYP